MTISKERFEMLCSRWKFVDISRMKLAKQMENWKQTTREQSEVLKIRFSVWHLKQHAEYLQLEFLSCQWDRNNIKQLRIEELISRRIEVGEFSAGSETKQKSIRPGRFVGARDKKALSPVNDCF